MKRGRNALAITVSTLLGIAAVSMLPADQPASVVTRQSAVESQDEKPEIRVASRLSRAGSNKLGLDWPQWGGTSLRNNTPVGKNIATEWDIGGFDRRTGQWLKEDAVNIKWASRVGSQTYGNPVVADGRVFVGTNNGGGYLARYPHTEDLGCMLAFRESDGQFLWQHSSEKLPTGRVHDWPLQGICCAPLAEGNRLWFVSSRGEVVCLDTEGYYDGEDDGPVKGEWGRLFKEDPNIVAGLKLGEVPLALRAVLEQNGIASQGRLLVKEQNDGWIIRGASKLVRAEVDGDRIAVWEVFSSETEPQPPVKLFTVESLLHTGLDQGHPSGALRALLKQSGFTLPSAVEVNAEQPGSKWTLTTKIGTSRTVRIAKAGPFLTAFKLITPDDKDEADTVWTFNMMKELGVSQHNMCSCSVTSLGDILFVNTSNGVDESHKTLPAPLAPSFMAMNKNTGKVYWTDKSPGTNILHGQWSSPTVATIDGVPQVIFGGGDGWVYSFRADEGNNGQPVLLWKFDANPKESEWILGGAGTRNNIIATPVVYEDLVYVAVGQDPEHGEGVGHLWCIDPTKQGDVSPQLAMKVEGNQRVLIPHRRLQAVIPEDGEVAVDNPNSAVVWHYSEFDQNGDGEIDFEESMHRSCGTVAIKNDLLYIADFSGLFHCLDAKTGKVHWTYDMLAAAWGSPLIVEDKVYIGDEDGDLSIFRLTSEKHDPVAEINMGNSVYSTPIVANNVLFIANKTHVFAIENTQ